MKTLQHILGNSGRFQYKYFIYEQYFVIQPLFSKFGTAPDVNIVNNTVLIIFHLVRTFL